MSVGPRVRDDRKLIYQLTATKCHDVVIPAGCDYRFCKCARDGWAIRRSLFSRFGLLGHLRSELKLATSNRFYCCLQQGSAIVSDAWITLSFCNHYPIERDAAVIGPVWTDPQRRGLGLATSLLQAGMNSICNSVTKIYIDTSNDNIAMQHVIEHCGFALMNEKPVESA